MTQDIIRMAREAGFKPHHNPDLYDCMVASDEAIERFAALAQAAERNKLATWMIAKGYATGHGDSIEDLLQELDWQIAENWTRGMVNGVEAEREACALVCINIANKPSNVILGVAINCADAIRART
jgi:hypothetical protein